MKIRVLQYWSHAEYMRNSKLMLHVHQHMLGLSALLQWLLWERNWRRAEGRVRSTFSWERCIRPTLSGQRERLPCMGCHEHVRVVCIRFLLWDVHWFQSLRLSDMSNHLSCGCRHVVNYWNGGLMEVIVFSITLFATLACLDQVVAYILKWFE
jgi:hypothetical protein